MTDGTRRARASAPRVHVHLFETPGRHESRFLREAGAVLEAGLADEVLLLGRAAPGLERVERPAPGIVIERLPQWSRRLPANKVLALLKIAEARHRWVRAAVRARAALVQCHSIAPLSAAVGAARALGVPLVYDAHELETERNGLRGVRQWAERRLERRLIPACDAVIVVSDAIADWYATTYGIARPTVVRNIPGTGGPLPSAAASPLRAKLGLGPDAIIFLYQGGLFRGRRVAQVLDAFADVPAPRHLVFMGYGELEGVVRARAETQANVHFLPAVPPPEVLAHTAGADVGICGVENVCLSYYYALPNKCFEYLHAGLAVLAPDYPELRRVTAETGSGWVLGEETAAWATAFRSLTPAAIAEARARAVAARTAFSWAAEEARLLELYRRVAA